MAHILIGDPHPFFTPVSGPKEKEFNVNVTMERSVPPPVSTGILERQKPCGSLLLWYDLCRFCTIACKLLGFCFFYASCRLFFHIVSDTLRFPCTLKMFLSSSTFIMVVSRGDIYHCLMLACLLYAHCLRPVRHNITQEVSNLLHPSSVVLQDLTNLEKIKHRSSGCKNKFTFDLRVQVDC